jgi:hypothetical protein
LIDGVISVDVLYQKQPHKKKDKEKSHYRVAARVYPLSSNQSIIATIFTLVSASRPYFCQLHLNLSPHHSSLSNNNFCISSFFYKRAASPCCKLLTAAVIGVVSEVVRQKKDSTAQQPQWIP